MCNYNGKEKRICEVACLKIHVALESMHLLTFQEQTFVVLFCTSVLASINACTHARARTGTHTQFVGTIFLFVAWGPSFLIQIGKKS